MIFIKRKKGFTLVELVVSIAIFAFMTALMVSRYGAFNQNTFLTNLAYDIALTLRTAQTYGLSVKNVDQSTQSYNAAYGVRFTVNDSTLTFFVDKNANGVVDSGENITVYKLTQGARLTGISVCNGVDTTTCPASIASAIPVTLVFKRPNPDVMVYVNGAAQTVFSFILLTLTSGDGSNAQSIIVRHNGQIEVGR